jgi:putative heme-binding domain-containing protein
VRDQGSDVGPNLATIAQAGAEKILLNVLDPNRELNPQYVNYTIETADFETHTGIIAAETATTITLKRAHGETDTIPRADIEDIRSEALSIMPEGFESAITPEAMADLIAYLTAE